MNAATRTELDPRALNAALSHRVNSEFCETCDKAGRFVDCCTCQVCGNRVCGMATVWINGKGNVCAHCLSHA